MPKIIIPTGALPPEFIPVRPNVEICRRPLFEGIRAGFTSPALEYLEGDLDANEYLGCNEITTFWFTVFGQSMVRAGIHHKDKVLANRAVDPRDGHMVVATVNNEHTLKYLRVRNEEIELHAANPEFEPIVFRDSDELLIWGVITGSMRRVRI
jgi:DNA polymerase V